MSTIDVLILCFLMFWFLGIANKVGVWINLLLIPAIILIIFRLIAWASYPWLIGFMEAGIRRFRGRIIRFPSWNEDDY